MISIVIPLLNEVGTLEQLHHELSELAAARGYELQMIFIDDGSTDGSWQIVERLAATDARVLGIRFRRNFGKAAALSAGFDAAQGEIIVTMDADLQDSPAEIPKLLAVLDAGADVVSGWKRERHDPWHKRYPSKVFNALVGKMTGVQLHDHNCGLKAYRRDVIHEIRLYGELHRFVPVLAAARGFRIGETAVEHRPRLSGVSKYGWTRIPKGLLDLLTVQFITRYGQRPQHWLGSAGLISLLLGGLGMVYLAFIWVWSRMPWSEHVVHLHETAALFYSLALLLFGSNLLAMGFVAEMIAASVSRHRDEFSVAQYTPPQGKNAGAGPHATTNQSAGQEHESR
ncbi:glycosyltransferase family 2 protein [Lacipirellula sp.]|uniref:glycosyltransferase family 2 protein n=1 Tax=Lacipirellula sp. TaxID=2691419 RepID=UPI003D0BE509